MTLYLIRRDLGGANEEDLDAASIRALSCIHNYEGMRWLTSYWGKSVGQIYCVYEAQSEQQILDHSRQSRIPCDEITPVVPVDPEEYASQVMTAVKA